MGSSPQPTRSEAAGHVISMDALSQRLESLCSIRHAPTAIVSTGLAAIDGVLPGGGLACGKVHEWISSHHPGSDAEPASVIARRGHWSPALTVLIELACRAAHSPDGRGHLVWIGENVWPYSAALARCGTGAQRIDLGRCLFVRATRAADRLWATDLALRSRSAAAVIADGSGFDLAATRRLQLAAETGGGLCLLARPPWERRELSAAATRWLVSFAPSSSMNRRWTVELLRCKGMQPALHAHRAWVLERDHATRALRVAADVLDRSGEAETGEAAVRQAG